MIAGLAESNGSLPARDDLKSPVGSAPGPALDNKYERTLPLPLPLLGH